MKAWMGWVLASLLVVVGLVLVVWHFMRGQKADARRAAVDMLVDWHRQDVQSKKRKLAGLKAKLGEDAAQTKALAQKLVTKRARLKQSYKDSGLSTDEIAERFSRIAL